MVLNVLSSTEVDLSDAATVCALGKITTHEYEALDTVAARNAYIVGIVRSVYVSDGSFAGWDCLARIASNISLPPSVVADVVHGTLLYAFLRPSAIPTSVVPGLSVAITRTGLDSITKVSPKTLGGKGWKQSEIYAAVLKGWSHNWGFDPFGPCTALAFTGVQRKVIWPRTNLSDSDALVLLGGLVDYDLDSNSQYSPGFVNAMAVAMRYVANIGSRMQGLALFSLLNLDVQHHSRMVQKGWMARPTGSRVHGAAGISPADWQAIAVSDCAVLSAFGYEPAAAYAESRLGMFSALVICSMYDLLYDWKTYNLGAPMLYVEAAGTAPQNMHCIFTTTVLDAMAIRIFHLDENTIPLYGDNALAVGAAWAPFNARYHTWERFVKYSRQIARSDSSDVRNIIAMAKESLVLPCSDVDEAWRQANTRGAETTLIPRITAQYTPSPSPDFPGLPRPDLCPSCTPAFQGALDAFEADIIHAVEGMPASVIKCAAVAIAAAIHRTCVFASGPDCCDVCACQIGRWADEASNEVMVTLMSSEHDTCASEWLLQCYVVGCVPLSPVSVPSILSGFDLRCEVTQDEGAMGSRDVLDV
ncbi:hypothetical protein DFH06DRAFT_481688 [Mycena polygramma]|nr:hypothetical protein DFH06DRAFT_481688 [Mycena polygramma]